MFKEMCKLLCFKKTHTTPFHPHCAGQGERKNRTLIELHALNVKNHKDKWDLNLGLFLMSYRSALQSSNGHSAHFFLFGREMRLPFDIMYRFPEIVETRSKSPNKVRKILKNADKRARDRLHLAHQRQQSYYDRCDHGAQFKVGNSVWLFNPIIQNGVVP